MAIKIALTYFNGDVDAATPWMQFRAVTSFISGAAGYFALRMGISMAPERETCHVNDFRFHCPKGQGLKK